MHDCNTPYSRTTSSSAKPSSYRYLPCCLAEPLGRDELSPARCGGERERPGRESREDGREEELAVHRGRRWTATRGRDRRSSGGSTHAIDRSDPQDSPRSSSP